MTPLDDSPPVSTEMTPPVCVLHRQLSRQRKAKYDGQIVLAFSPASTLALQVGQVWGGSSGTHSDPKVV